MRNFGKSCPGICVDGEMLLTLAALPNLTNDYSAGINTELPFVAWWTGSPGIGFWNGVLFYHGFFMFGNLKRCFFLVSIFWQANKKNERAVTLTPDTPGSTRRSGYRLREKISCLKNCAQCICTVSVGLPLVLSSSEITIRNCIYVMTLHYYLSQYIIAYHHT